MSDVSKRAPSTASNEGKMVAGSKAKTFSKDLHRVTKELTELIKDKAGVLEFEELISLKGVLQQKLEQRNRELEDTKTILNRERAERRSETEKLRERCSSEKVYRERLFKDHEDRHTAWERERHRLSQDSAELSQVKEQLQKLIESVQTQEAKHEALQKDFDRCHGDRERLSQENGDLQRDNTLLSMQMEKMKRENKESREFVETLHESLGVTNVDLDLAVKRLEDLAENMFQLAERYFTRDIPHPHDNGVLTIRTAPTLIYLLPSNSPTAQKIRCAFVKALIARALSDYIFTDFYCPLVAGVDPEGVRRFLGWVEDENPKEAVILRCQLAKACANTHEAAEIPSHVAGSICESLDAWFGDDQVARNSFSVELTRLLDAALGIWKPIQRHTEAFRSTVAVSDGSLSRWHQEQYRTSPDVDTPGLPIALLFPQIYSTASAQLLYPGLALLSTQDYVVAAAEERRANKSPQVEGKSLRRTSTLGEQPRALAKVYSM